MQDSDIIVLKDKLIVSENGEIKETHKFLLEEYLFPTPYPINDYSFVKEDILVDAIILSRVAQTTPDCIMKYCMYGDFSSAYRDTNLIYTDEYDFNSLNVGKCEYFILHDEKYFMCKIIEYKTGKIKWAGDFRLIEHSISEIKDGKIEPSSTLDKHNVYVDSTFDTDILLYCHTNMQFNGMFDIIPVDNTNDILRLYNDYESKARSSNIFVIATSDKYKFVEIGESILEMVSIKHAELDSIMEYIHVKGYSIWEYGDSGENIETLNI